MRLKFAGKVVLFVLGLAGLFALWRQVPRRTLPWRIPVHVNKPDMPAGQAAELEPADRERTHTGLLIGYTGAPPGAALDLSKSGIHPLPALGRETGEVVALKERETSIALLTDVEMGRLDAAVVDFPSVVFQARRGKPPYHVVLLVSWRTGADVLTARGGRWDPAQPIFYESGTSGEYLLRRVLSSGRYSPADVAAGRVSLDRDRDAPPRDAPAAAGRLERLPGPARGWPVVASTLDVPVRMPDVLIVNTKWARRHPETVTALVRAWLEGQADIEAHPERWQRSVREQARRLEMGIPSMAESMRPAPLEDQMAFAGLREKGTSYTTLVMQQMRTVEPGPRPPDDTFSVPVDWEPLTEAAPLMVG